MTRKDTSRDAARRGHHLVRSDRRTASHTGEKDLPDNAKKRSSTKNKILVLCALQGVLLGCIAFMAYSLVVMERNRIPSPVFNFISKERFCPIPIEFQRIAVRIETAAGSYGSGVAVGRRLVVTNSHVVAGHVEGDTVWVDAYRNDGFERVMGTVENIDKARDLAAIRLPMNFNFKLKARFAMSDPGWGSVVCMVGCPSGMLPLATRGHFGYRSMNKPMITCEGFWGNSGGPVFNPAGLVIGIAHKMGVATKPGGTQVWATHLHMVIPHDWIRSYLKEHKADLDK